MELKTTTSLHPLPSFLDIATISTPPLPCCHRHHLHSLHPIPLLHSYHLDSSPPSPPPPPLSTPTPLLLPSLSFATTTSTLLPSLSATSTPPLPCCHFHCHHLHLDSSRSSPLQPLPQLFLSSLSIATVTSIPLSLHHCLPPLSLFAISTPPLSCRSCRCHHLHLDSSPPSLSPLSPLLLPSLSFAIATLHRHLHSSSPPSPPQPPSQLLLPSLSIAITTSTPPLPLCHCFPPLSLSAISTPPLPCCHHCHLYLHLDSSPLSPCYRDSPPPPPLLPPLPLLYSHHLNYYSPPSLL